MEEGVRRRESSRLCAVTCPDDISLLVGNISRISTDFDRSRGQLIKRELDVVIIVLCYAIKNFINIMITKFKGHSNYLLSYKIIRNNLFLYVNISRPSLVD